MNLNFTELFNSHLRIYTFYIDKILILITIFLLSQNLRTDIVIMITYFSIIPYLIYTHRTQLFKPFFLATLISLAWMGIAKEMYDYGLGYITFFGINSYAFFSWSCGLFACYLIYLHYEKLFSSLSLTKRFFIFTLFYAFSLLMLEWLFYTFFGIQNQITAQYSSLAICNCLRAPVWMQMSYFILGPLLFLSMKFIKFKNPHYLKISS